MGRKSKDYLQLTHFAVEQKLIQHCKAAEHQFKKKKKKANVRWLAWEWVVQEEVCSRQKEHKTPAQESSSGKKELGSGKENLQTDLSQPLKLVVSVSYSVVSDSLQPHGL